MSLFVSRPLSYGVCPSLSAVGFSNPRIADLLRTSTDTVRGVVNKAKKKK